jgi:methylated-DNA-[protein]-cysteine S-methyltransferase
MMPDNAIFYNNYESPLGSITAAASNDALVGLWFDGQKYFIANKTQWQKEPTNIVLTQLKQWLSDYFAGSSDPFPGKLEPLNSIGSKFRQEVWTELLQIEYAKTSTYGAIASKLANRRNIKRFSAQAVGGAVGHNPISIIIPCHRVIGANGSLTGYAGGINKKIALLKLEGVLQ